MKQSYRITFIFCSFLQIACAVHGQSNFSDCGTAKILCNKAPILIDELTGYGSFSESSLGPCFRNEFQETNSIWLKWEVASAGSLSFIILPFEESDDIDFALFRVEGFENCNYNEPIRCMAAGPNLGDENGSYHGCTGATGLHDEMGGKDKSYGCSKHDVNFLRSIEMKAGEYYALFINNFRSSGGILVEWDGTGTFQSFPACSQSSASTSLASNRDGSIQFSEPFPNPVTDRVSITANSDEAHLGQIQIIRSDGQLEFTLPVTLSIGANTLELPTESLRNGVHFIRIKVNSKTQIFRFVKF